MRVFIAIFVVTFSVPSFSKTFTEFDLVEMIENSPKLKSLDSQIQRLEAEISGVMANFSPTLDSSITYNNTNEPPLIQFEPPPSPFYSAEVKLNHNTIYGVGYSFGVLGESIETAPSNDPNAFVFNSARLNPTFSVSMDLLKNRLGSETGNQVKSLRATQRALAIERVILKETLSTEIRKLFWSHNILIEKKKINQRLLKLSESLLRDVRKKKKDGFVESGDLYSAQSQSAGQKTNVALLTYQIEKVKRTLSSLLPELPPVYDLKTQEMSEEASKIFFKCLDSIVALKETPFQFSYISDKIKEKKMQLSYTEASLESFSKPTLRFFGQLSGSNVDTRLLDATTDYLNDSQYGFSFGLNFSMSLGNHIKKQRESLLKAERYQINSEGAELRSELEALHLETVNSIKLLNQALIDQRQATMALSKSYNFKQKQYNQARADLIDVIQEQNNYLSSQVNQLDIVQVIIESLLNYKSKFQKFSCQGVTL